MSDVREQLVACVDAAGAKAYPLNQRGAATEVADAIMERFEVTPKPVVTDFDLGVMVGKAYVDMADYARAGASMREKLEAKGLKIVRVEE